MALLKSSNAEKYPSRALKVKKYGVSFNEAEDILEQSFIPQLFQGSNLEEEDIQESDIHERLIEVIESDDVDMLQELLSEARRRNVVNQCGRHHELSLLHLASQFGALEICKYCIEVLEQDVNQKSRDYRQISPLHEAIKEGHTELIELLLTHDALYAPGTLNRYGDCAVYVAVRYKQIESLQKLLDWNISVNATNDNALNVYQRDFSYSALKCCIGADTPLQLAVRSGWVVGVRFLLEAGANIYSTGPKANECILHTALLNQNNEEIVHLLLNAGFNADHSVMCKQRGILHSAISFYKDHMLGLLLSHISSPKNFSEGLFAAISRGSLDVVKQILLHNVDVNYLPISYKRTPLHDAINSGEYEIAKCLLSEHNADPTIDCLPYEVARICKNRSTTIVVATFYRWPTKRKPGALSKLHQGCCDTLGLILSKSSTVNDLCPESGSSALWIACSYGMVCMVLKLLQAGADPHQQCRGVTPLQYVFKDLMTNIYPNHWRFLQMVRTAQCLLSYISDFNKETWIHEFITQDWLNLVGKQGWFDNVGKGSGHWKKGGTMIKELLDDWLPSDLHEIPKLKAMCRSQIGRSLTSYLDETYDSLPLPPSLQDYVRLKDISEAAMMVPMVETHSMTITNQEHFLGLCDQNLKEDHSDLCLCFSNSEF